jgi:hypothetical protein
MLYSLPRLRRTRVAFTLHMHDLRAITVLCSSCRQLKAKVLTSTTAAVGYGTRVELLLMHIGGG